MGKELIKTEGALPVQFDFVDFEGKSNIPAATLTNARIALQKLGLPAWHDLFANKKYVGGSALNSEVGGQVTDDLIAAIRIMIREKFKFDPGKNHTWDAVNLLCRERGRHPVRDFLQECFDAWDGLNPPAPSIDFMLRDYFGAPDTPFVRGVSRIVMVASCRRIFEPGAKFDYMTVLESPEGFNKSSALAALYGTEWFSDQTILGLDDKQLAETLRGRWCIECADLSGMKKAEVEKVKAQLSRFEDRTRPAYGRAVIDSPRSCVFWGTTNDMEYLRSQTGNRRFFPIPVGRIDVAALERDRVALWGEAMAMHKSGESIMLPEPLWAAAGIEQERRTMADAWNDMVANVTEAAIKYTTDVGKAEALEYEGAYGAELGSLGTVYEANEERERVTSLFVLWKVIGVPPDRMTAEHGQRLGRAMRAHGWKGPQPLWIGGRTVKGYQRSLQAKREPWDLV